MTKITLDRAVVQQALHVATAAGYPVALIAALRAALSEPQPNTLHDWVFKRNADGSIGIFAPPPKPGESQRTSDCVGTNQRDLNELLGKLADHMATLAEPETCTWQHPGKGGAVTQELREAAQQALEALEGGADSWQRVGPAIDALKAALAEPTLQTCNCRWEGEVQVQQCTLHEAHVDAIHEWAERAKTAEKKLAALAEPDSDSPERRCGGPGCDMTCCQPVQEPVGAVLVNRESREGVMFYSVDMIPDPSTLKDHFELVPVYADPPQRLPLTEEEIWALYYALPSDDFERSDRIDFARAIERAHGIKE